MLREQTRRLGVQLPIWPFVDSATCCWRALICTSQLANPWWRKRIFFLLACRWVACFPTQMVDTPLCCSACPIAVRFRNEAKTCSRGKAQPSVYAWFQDRNILCRPLHLQPSTTLILPMAQYVCACRISQVLPFPRKRCGP